MLLIIGGAYQGKLEYARSYTGLAPEEFVDGSTCSLEEILTCRGMNHFHEYVRRLLKEGKDVSSLAETILQKNPDIVLVSNEVGYGIVPIDKEERQFRETCGRICCSLAKEAQVHRVMCGIGKVLKP